MVKRLMLNKPKQSPNSGSFKPGHTLSVGNRGYPLARRQTNRFFAETLFHEMIALDPKEQQTQFTLIVRRAIRDAKQDGQLAVRLVLDVCNRFLGQPTLPVAWKDLTDAKEQVPTITREMTPAEAQRIFMGMLRRPNDDPETNKARERERLLDYGPHGPAIDLDDEDEDLSPPVLPPPRPPSDFAGCPRTDAEPKIPRRPLRTPVEDEDDIAPDDVQPRRSGMKEAIARAKRGY
jgi:hypothetical protein